MTESEEYDILLRLVGRKEGEDPSEELYFSLEFRYFHPVSSRDVLEFGIHDSRAGSDTYRGLTTGPTTVSHFFAPPKRIICCYRPRITADIETDKGSLGLYRKILTERGFTLVKRIPLRTRYGSYPSLEELTSYGDEEGPRFL